MGFGGVRVHYRASGVKALGFRMLGASGVKALRFRVLQLGIGTWGPFELPGLRRA